MNAYAVRRLAIIVAAFSYGFVFVPAAAGANSDPPSVIPDDEGDKTPMERMVGKRIDDHLDKHSDTTCRALKGNRPGKNNKGKAKACGIPATDVLTGPDPDDPAKCSDCGTSTLDGKGKKIVRMITIRSDEPKQRKLDDLTALPPADYPGLVVAPSSRKQNAHDTETDIDGGVVGATPATNPFAPLGADGNPKTVPAFSCASFGKGKGTTVGTDGQCDLTREMRLAVNEKFKKKAEDTHDDKGKPLTSKKKAFHVDANGDCLASDVAEDATVKCGAEARQQKFKERFSIECPDGFSYDGKRCVKLKSLEAASFDKSAVFVASERRGLQKTTSSFEADVMMGFTFAPPRVRWGYEYSEDVCIDLFFDEWCFTIISVWFGYDFDLSVGLRLPATLVIPAVPEDVLASTSLRFNPTIAPKDYSYAEYVKFCNDRQMAPSSFIANCTDKFGFPEYFSKQVNKLHNGYPVDGKEFVAEETIKAGLFVELFEIPVINFGVNSSADFATLCTLYKIYKAKQAGLLANAENLLKIGVNLSETDSRNWLDNLKAADLNCASFEPPYGYEDVFQPALGTYPIKSFPFVPDSIELGADCAEALAKNKFVTVGTKRIPFCTGLLVDYKGAKLGLGLELGLSAGSTRIDASWKTARSSVDASAASDAALAGAGNADFKWLVPRPPAAAVGPVLGPVTFDNHAAGTDVAQIEVDDFRFCMNTVQLSIGVSLDLGGILSVIPDLPTITVYRLNLGLGDCGIPIPQHHGTGPVLVQIPVINYAASIAGAVPAGADPTLVVGPKTLKIKPGRSGTFNLKVTNEGSDEGDFDHFRVVLPDANPAVTPALPRGWTTTPDAAAFLATTLVDVPKHSVATTTVPLTIAPFRDALTRPGFYPVPIFVDSKDARILSAPPTSMPATDPLGIRRLAATDTVNVIVLAFFAPKVEALPPASAAKPGAPGQAYNFLVTNLGNAPDTFSMVNTLVDFNTANCTLTTLGGSSAGCPYRAKPTVIPAAWTTVAGFSPSIGPLGPLGNQATGYRVSVPPDWAGMRDTIYQIVATSTSTQDDEDPKAKSSVTVSHKVIATKQSMTRYIGLEIEELVQKITAANAAGTRTGGLLPLLTREVQVMHGKALDAIVAGDLAGGSKSLATAIKGMQAFLAAMPALPQALLDDWNAAANAIIRDMQDAMASNVTSS